MTPPTWDEFRIANALAFHDRFCTHEGDCCASHGACGECTCCQMARLLKATPIDRLRHMCELAKDTVQHVGPDGVLTISTALRCSDILDVIGREHFFRGRSDRGCDLCGKPDRHPDHR